MRQSVSWNSEKIQVFEKETQEEILNKENSLKIIETNEQLKAEKQQELKEVNYKLVDLSDKYLKIVDLFN